MNREQIGALVAKDLTLFVRNRFFAFLTVLGLVVALAPILSVVAVWAALRWRFARRAGATALLATSPGGQHLLALRALAGRPLHELVAVSDDPVAAWDAEDPDVTRALADLETRRWGVRLRGPALAS